MKPILDGLCRTCDVQLQEERKCVGCFVVARRREKNFQRRCLACANKVQLDCGQALDDNDIASADQVDLLGHGESLFSSFSVMSSLPHPLRLQAAASQGIIDGVFTPNEKNDAWLASRNALQSQNGFVAAPAVMRSRPAGFSFLRITLCVC